MSYIYFGNQNISRGIMVLVVACLLTTTAISTICIPANTVSIDETLTYSFTFIKPGLQTDQVDNYQYTTLQMPGCMAIGKQAGNPMLPVKSVKLLLPAMTTATSVNVVGIPVELASIETPVYPYQNPVPIGFEPEEFQFNTELYDSDSLYPSALDDGYHIGYCRGYAIIDITLNPVQYIPGEGRLFYYPELIVTIDLEDTGEVNQFFRNIPEDKAWVETLVYNPEIADTYTVDLPTFGYPDGLCDPSDDYDYVIITTTHNSLDYWQTNGSTPYNWDSLMDKHEQDDGLKCTLVTIQDITACTDYHSSDPLFNDIEAHIREFCKDAYEDWETQYIFVGGDAEWIPARLMDSSAEPNVDSDIYWNHLDSTFNEDHDNDWGEEGDPGFDLYAELFIGRITCDTPQDVSNWMTKSFYYADNGNIDYLENAAFYGGGTGWPCQGDDFIDYSAIKGTDRWLGPIPGAHGPYPSWLGFNYGFETWNAVNPGNEYNLSVKWTAEPPNPGWQGGSESVAINELKNAINNDQVTLISGIAHANAQTSLDVSMISWESDYHNTKPFFIHDFGCHCGDMDAANDGVLHSMLFHSNTELAFACIYNTCFGWGSLLDTNSSSALQMKLFWDYFFDVANNSGSTMNWQLGKAMAYSKDTMAPTINWTYDDAPGSWRAIIQGCLLFGDPAQRIKPPKTVVNISPSAQTVERGDTFTASVYVESADWVMGIGFVTITFDPTLLQANDVTEGDFFGGNAMIFEGGTIDNVAGTISEGYAAVLKEDAVNIPGSVYMIEFTAKDKIGTSDLTMDGISVAGIIEDLHRTVENGSVTVTEFFDLTIDIVGNGTTTLAEGIHGYPSGTVVDLDAFPDDGWTFDGWSGDIIDSNPSTTITMDSNKAVTATFTDISPPEITSVVLLTSDPIDTEPCFGWERVTCTVTDNVEVRDVKLAVTDPDSSTAEHPMIKDGDTYSYETTLTQSGSYTYHIWADDISGNNATSSPEQFALPTNWDVNMNGQVHFGDFMDIIRMYAVYGFEGWIREDVDNNGHVHFSDLMDVLRHYGELWT